MRRARRRWVACVAVALVLAVAAAAAASACGSVSPPSPSVSEAYRLAHPNEGVPDTLQTVEMPRDEVRRRIAAIVGEKTRIVLPAGLPSGFEPAAPYIAVGDGTARPNPEGWGKSYRVSYTNGRGLLVMTVGAEAPPEGVMWSGERLRVDGRSARVGRAGNAVVVATTGEDGVIVVTGWRVERAAVLEMAGSVTTAE